MTWHREGATAHIYDASGNFIASTRGSGSSADLEIRRADQIVREHNQMKRLRDMYLDHVEPQEILDAVKEIREPK